MFEFTETILIHAAPATVWEVLRDIESWWPASNPEHDSLERLDDRDILDVGTRLRIHERIGGIPGEAVGEITHVNPPFSVTWEAPSARYRWLGMSIQIGEGVTWSIEPHPEPHSAPHTAGTKLSAHVWATFPPGRSGRLLELAFRHLLRGVEKDREHTRTELRYLKHTIEAGNEHYRPAD